MQWQISHSRKKTWKTDLGLSLFFVWLLGNFLTAGFTPEIEALNQKIRLAKIVFGSEYRTQWTDKENSEYAFYLKRMEAKTPQVEIIEGNGRVEVKQWNWQGIKLNVQSKKAMTLRLNHSFFPVWGASLYKGDALPLKAEDKTGLMLLEVPGGEHKVELTYDVSRSEPYLLFSEWLSIAAWAGLFLAFIKPKFFDSKAIA